MPSEYSPVASGGKKNVVNRPLDLGSLGDVIHTVPAVAALRRATPEARIDWLVEAPHQEIVDASHTDRQSTLVVRSNVPVDDPEWTVEPLSMEDLVLAYMAGGGTAASTRASSACSRS